MRGLFEISNFNEAADDDILDMKINESAFEDVTIPVPGGYNEKPGKGGIEIDEDTYNSAIDKLQRSFKEAADTMAMLRHAKIVESSSEDLMDMLI